MTLTQPDGWSEADWTAFQDELLLKRDNDLLTRRINAIPIDERRMVWRATRDSINRRGYALMEMNMKAEAQHWTVDFKREFLYLWDQWQTWEDAQRSMSNGKV